MADYRIYHSEDYRCIVIDGVAEVFPEASLEPVFLGGDKIEVRNTANGFRVFGPLSYTRIRREDGTGFTGVSDCFNYLDTELEKRYEATDIDWTNQDW
jgi:hypothetical protein